MLVIFKAIVVNIITPFFYNKNLHVDLLGHYIILIIREVVK